MIHSILEWKKTTDSKNGGADGNSDSVAEVQSIYLPSVRDSEDECEKELPTVKAEGQQSDETDGNSTDRAAASTDKTLNVQSDNTDDEHEEENPTKDDGSQYEDDDSGSVDEEGAIQSMHIITKSGEKDKDRKQPLLGLVLTPTRELAVQVKHHIDAVAQFTGL